MQIITSDLDNPRSYNKLELRKYLITELYIDSYLLLTNNKISAIRLTAPKGPSTKSVRNLAALITTKTAAVAKLDNNKNNHQPAVLALLGGTRFATKELA